MVCDWGGCNTKTANLIGAEGRGVARRSRWLGQGQKRSASPGSGNLSNVTALITHTTFVPLLLFKQPNFLLLVFNKHLGDYLFSIQKIFSFSWLNESTKSLNQNSVITNFKEIHLPFSKKFTKKKTEKVILLV